MTVLLAWLLADFLSGAFHFYEDRVLGKKSRFEFLQGIIDDNIRHHEKPILMIMESYWGNINTTAQITVPLAIVLAPFAPPVFTLAVVFATFANIVHRWAHSPHNLQPVRVLQKVGVFCRPNQHNRHHYRRGRVIPREWSRDRYCVMSSWLNPILDLVHFWDVVFWVLRKSRLA